MTCSYLKQWSNGRLVRLNFCKENTENVLTWNLRPNLEALIICSKECNQIVLTAQTRLSASHSPYVARTSFFWLPRHLDHVWSLVPVMWRAKCAHTNWIKGKSPRFFPGKQVTEIDRKYARAHESPALYSSLCCAWLALASVRLRNAKKCINAFSAANVVSSLVCRVCMRQATRASCSSTLMVCRLPKS